MQPNRRDARHNGLWSFRKFSGRDNWMQPGGPYQRGCSRRRRRVSQAVAWGSPSLAPIRVVWQATTSPAPDQQLQAMLGRMHVELSDPAMHASACPVHKARPPPLYCPLSTFNTNDVRGLRTHSKVLHAPELQPARPAQILAACRPHQHPLRPGPPWCRKPHSPAPQRARTAPAAVS
jgi:hypothetical protein